MRRFLLISAAALACATSARAANDMLGHDYIVPSLGVNNVLHSGTHPVIGGVEYRFREWDFGVRPTLGVTADTKGSVYGYGGINWEIGLTPQLMIIPNFMVGAYHQGDSKDLGGAIEFRSGLELDYQLPNTHRVGIALNHTSNASIYRKNPGVEAVVVNYSIPVSGLGR